MSDLIDRVNTADRLANYWRMGTLAFVVLRDRLLSEGWYDIKRRADIIEAHFNGVEFKL